MPIASPDISASANTLDATREPLSVAPHIVFFLTDDHGQRDSTPYGSTEVHTPNMERLARAGLTFDNAFVASPTCAPSRACLFTGMMPITNGAMDNHSRPRADVKKLPAYLRERGYEVVAIGKVTHYGHTSDYGFDYWAHDTFHDAASVPAALKWLRERPDTGKPLALFVGTNWPHVPWPDTMEGYDPNQITLLPTFINTPATYLARARYYAAVSRMDAELGAVYDAARECLGTNTLFITSNDHGAQFPFAKWNLYDAGIRTPLIAAWPGVIEPNTRTSALVSLVDILPTLNEIAGGPPDPAWDGRSFAAVLRGAATEHRDHIFTTHSRDADWNIYPCRSVRTRRWKYIRNLLPEAQHTTHIDRTVPPLPWQSYWSTWLEAATSDPEAAAVVARYHTRPAEELYDLEADPFEQSNLATDPAYAETLASLRAELDAWMENVGDHGLASETTSNPKAQTPTGIRAIGIY